MSPVQQSRMTPRTVVIMAVSAVIVAVGVLAFVLLSVPRLTETSPVEVRLGSEPFDAGFATRQAEAIATEGPILYSDVAGGERDIYVQHVGEDPRSGWYAFDARRTGAGRACTLGWDAASRQFEDPCDGAAVDERGTGLTQFAVEGSGPEGDERVVVDLRTTVEGVGQPEG